MPLRGDHVFRGHVVAGATRSDRRLTFGPLHCCAVRQGKLDLPTGDSSGRRPLSAKTPRAAQSELPAARRAERATIVAWPNANKRAGRLAAIVWCAANATSASAAGLACL